MVVDRNSGPLADEVVGASVPRDRCRPAWRSGEPPYRLTGPEGTFSEQATRKHFHHSAHGDSAGLDRGSVPGGEQNATPVGVVPVENSGREHDPGHARHVSLTAAAYLRRVELRVHQCPRLRRGGRIEDIERSVCCSRPQSPAQTQLPEPRGDAARCGESAVATIAR